MVQLKHHDFEHQHRITGRPNALAARTAMERRNQLALENLEIHHRRQPFKRISCRAQFRVPICNVAKVLSDCFRYNRKRINGRLRNSPMSADEFSR
jgi:hypothetical protein